jgi:hypothetical protein
MKHSFAKAAIAAAATLLCMAAQATPQGDYTYTPSPGVHETKYFHGCYDHTDVTRRPKINVNMNGLSTSDVYVDTRVVEEGKPSTEMVTFRLKNQDASFSVQFRSNDGPHCQQGVQSIVFRDAVLRNRGDLNALR